MEKNSCEKSSLCSSFENESTALGAVIGQGELSRPTIQCIPLGSPFTQRCGSVYSSIAGDFVGGASMQPDGILTSPEHSRPARLPFSGTGTLASTLWFQIHTKLLSASLQFCAPLAHMTTRSALQFCVSFKDATQHTKPSLTLRPQAPLHRCRFDGGTMLSKHSRRECGETVLGPAPRELCQPIRGTDLCRRSSGEAAVTSLQVVASK
jgi:hypothetical protein